MSNRQKIYITLAVSAGVCTGIAIFLYVRHRRQLALSKSSPSSNSSAKASSLFSSIKSRQERQYTDISATDINKEDSESVRFRSGEGTTVEVDIPGGFIPLTDDQAIVLIRFLDETHDDVERLHRILTNIANAAAFKESQINLANAGCIDRLREILLSTDNETTQNKVLLAFNNLALNEYTIKYFSGLVPIVINLCIVVSSSVVRLSGLRLLINMSVLELLHDEYMKHINNLDELIKSTYGNSDELLSVGKVLVNLSTNKLNFENLLKLTGVEIKTIVRLCTPSKKTHDDEQSTKLEDVLLRFITFYCNLADLVVKELQSKLEDKEAIHRWFTRTESYQPGAAYFELFDHAKQMNDKTILRPQYSSNTINSQIKRLREATDTIRRIQFDSSVASVQDEFKDDDDDVRSPAMVDFSTPKKISDSMLMDKENIENTFNEFAKEVDDEFEDDHTTLQNDSIQTDQSLNSFASFHSIIDEKSIKSPEPEIII